MKKKSPIKRIRKIKVFNGDNRVVLKKLADNSVDSIVTDPPYALVSIVKRFANSPRSKNTENTENPYGRTGRGFMGQRWDTAQVVQDVLFWQECLRVLKPGGHLLAFGGTRTYHRMVCAIEDSGFEIRDMIQWLYGAGFPKSHDVSKGIDKAAGAKRDNAGIGKRKITNYGMKNRCPICKKPYFSGNPCQCPKPKAVTNAAKKYHGWGTALKPANEPIVLARKPLSEKTVAANVLKWGTGAINVDGCRVSADWANERGESWLKSGKGKSRPWHGSKYVEQRTVAERVSQLGRWPANVITDGSDEVVVMFPRSKDGVAVSRNKKIGKASGNKIFSSRNVDLKDVSYGGEGSAARFFYQAKANKTDRAGSRHPTVKPIALMRYLIRLVTPHGGLVLDPFAGSGTTAEAAEMEGCKIILVENNKKYQKDIQRRLQRMRVRKSRKKKS